MSSIGSFVERNSKVKIIIILVLVLVLLLMLMPVFGSSIFDDGSRTIMIYMSGNDLEGKGGLATSELDSLDYKKIDLNKINVLIYTGGTKKWYNDYVDSEHNYILKLTNDGLKKIETYDKVNLGDYKTFRDFLTYGRKNYKASHYDLVMWDHGGAVDGAIWDQLNNDDNLTPVEMKKAMLETEFVNSNKLDLVIFRTCLNGTLEISSVFSEHAKYLVASEEVTMGATGENVLGYINNISDKDSDLTIAKRFIKSYQTQIKNMKFLSNKDEDIDSTYSIVDLSKINNLEKKLNDFFEKIDLNDNYVEVAKVRSNLHQYAVDTANTGEYDMVDLYQLIDNLSSLNSNKASELKKAINDAIVFNWATNKYSNGMSIYFPYNGRNLYKKHILDIYKNLNFAKTYYNFINNFFLKQSNSKKYNYNFLDNEISLNDSNEFSIKLSDEQISTYANSSYIVFKKEDDGMYTPIFSSGNSYLTDDGYVRTKITDNLLKIYDPEDKKEYYMQVKQISEMEDDLEYTTVGVLFKKTDSLFDAFSGSIHLRINNNNEPYITSVYLKDKDNVDRVTGMTADFYDFDWVDFGNFRYKITNDDGSYNPNWQSNSVYYLIEVHPKEKDFKFVRTSIENDTLYCVFKINDINGNSYYSNIMKIN